MFFLFNTLSRKKEEFTPLKKGVVSIYTCGPTVYNFAHIGNLRTYIFEDLLKRALLFRGYKVKHAMNITDVGHLTSDADEGEDKMEIGARREGKHPLEIARFYEKKFFSDLKDIGAVPPSKVKRATETVAQQIAIIKILEKRGFTYKDKSAVYFNTSKLPEYGKLSGQKISDKKTGSRKEVVVDSGKKNPADFALWFFIAGRYQNHILRWPSPWGEGFPGWHIECSAISRNLLGQPFDIHCGGVDHIGTHHSNEMAQSEAAFNLPLANVWMHGEFLLINDGLMGKSKGNFLTLDSLKRKGFFPLDFRYLCLTAHYRSKINFTWEGLAAAAAARATLLSFMRSQKFPTRDAINKDKEISYRKDFSSLLENDLNIPGAVALAWKTVKDSSLSITQRKRLLSLFDKVLNIGLREEKSSPIPASVRKILTIREKMRRNAQFIQADTLRKELEALGYEVEDTPSGVIARRKNSKS